jgi:ABC-2 type transport system permease protein
MTAAVAGTAPLLRASLRHDGRRFVPFIALTTALSVSSVIAYSLVFPSPEARAGLAAAIGANPALGLIFGPARDLTTVDGFNAWRSLALGGFLTALGAILLVTATTRGQEDSGQAELLAAGVMGRTTRLLSAVVMALVLSLVLGLVAGLVTVVFGGDLESSMLLGMTFAATGWMFAAVAAVTAQIGSDSRTANSMAMGVLGVLFIARGFLYSVSAPDWTTWINPLGWMTETRPASGNVWWPLLLAVAFTLVVLVLAFVLQARRDFGQGAIAPQPGPARGRDRSPFRLAFRLNRGAMMTWAVAFVALGVVFGYFAGSIKDVFGSNSAVQQILAAGATTPEALIAAFVATILGLVGILASIPGVQVMVRVRSEEMEDRVEPVMATAVSRPGFYAGNVAVAFLVPALCVLIAGTLIALIASVAGIGIDATTVFFQAVVTIPAVWTVVAFSVAVVGARPQVMLAAWGGVLISFVLTVLGPSFHLWDWILAISPFWHVPNVAAAAPNWSGLLVIAAACLVLMAIGFAGFGRRDLAR